MLFSLTNPEVAIMMMGIFLFAVLLGFRIAFTLMGMVLVFVYYAYFYPTRWNIFLIIGYSNFLFKTPTLLWIIMSLLLSRSFYSWDI